MKLSTVANYKQLTDGAVEFDYVLIDFMPIGSVHF